MCQSLEKVFLQKVAQMPSEVKCDLELKRIRYEMNKSTIVVTSVQISLRKIHLKQTVNRPIFKCFCSFKKMSTIFLKNVLFLDLLEAK